MVNVDQTLFPLYTKIGQKVINRPCNKYVTSNMGLSGYTSLSLDQKRYTRLRKNWDSHINTDQTFTVWATNILERAIERERELNQKYADLHWVGSTQDGGCIIQEKGEVIRITYGKNTLTCDHDKGMCKHILFAVLHPEF